MGHHQGSEPIGRPGTAGLDTDAAAVISQHSASLARYLSRRLPPDAAEDVLQDVWLSWWSMRERYRDEGRLGGYLRRIAERRAADWHRRENQGAAQGDPIPATYVVDPDIAADLLRRTGLGPTDLLWQRVLEDRSLGELSAIHGVTLGTVKSRLHAQGAQARRRLDDWLVDRRHADTCQGLLHRHVLGAETCALCRDLGETFAVVARAAALPDIFQTSYFTVESDLSAWLDADAHLAFGVRQPTVVYSSPRELGEIRRLRNGRGEDMRGRVHATDAYGKTWWTYGLVPADGHRFDITYRVGPEDAERASLIRASTRGFRVETGLTLPRDGGAEGALTVQLPASAEVAAADPPPSRVADMHGRPTLTWLCARDLPFNPIVIARWR